MQNAEITRERFQEPPIQEVVCEVHFDLSSPISKNELELLQPILKDSFPSQQLVIEKSINVQINAETAEAKTSDVGQRLICRSADDKDLIQVSSNFLAVNQLAPYKGWDEYFRDRILRDTKTVSEALKQLKYKRIGLRYINLIHIDADKFNWVEWINCELPVPKSNRFPTAAFQSNLVLLISDEIRMVVNIGSQPNQTTKKHDILLDLDVVWEGKSIGIDELRDLLDELHNVLYEGFSSYLTHNLRKQFQPIT